MFVSKYIYITSLFNPQVKVYLFCPPLTVGVRPEAADRKGKLRWGIDWELDEDVL